MLDAELKEQLQSVFAPIENDIELRYDETTHASQAELEELLRDVASTHFKISVESSGVHKDVPQFTILHRGNPTGITFKGIPGGHEFSSLVLAILNSDGKGKLPDANMTARIQRLKGPIRVKTYMSLSCENCPDVVQALNLMALLHDDFEHEVIDGSYVQAEVEKLGLQGVPAVVVDGKLLHSGRAQFLDLLAKLENTFGSNATGPTHLSNPDLGDYDVVVIGGGPAGASAAIYTARKGLKVAVLAERIGGQVQDTKGIENMISVLYTEGPELSAKLREHMESYPIRLFEQRRVAKLDTSDAKAKKILLEGGEHLTGKTVIVATGAKWRELNVPGEKDYLGRGVAYCPHCDGPFYKGKRVAVVGGGNSGVEAAIDLAGIVREVVLFEFMDTLKADQVLVDKLKSLPNASIILSAKTKQVVGDGAKVTSLEYEDRKTGDTAKVDLDGVFVQIGLLPNSGFLKDSGVELTKFGEVIVDEKGRTNVPGIYAAGDVTTTPYKQIVISMGEGAKVALAAFEDRMRASS